MPIIYLNLIVQTLKRKVLPSFIEHPFGTILTRCIPDVSPDSLSLHKVREIQRTGIYTRTYREGKTGLVMKCSGMKYITLYVGTRSTTHKIHVLSNCERR